MSFVDAVVLPSSEIVILDAAVVLDFDGDTVAAVADYMATSKIDDKPVAVVVGVCNVIADKAVGEQEVLSVEHRIA